jgi:hypothetical protein
MTTLIPKYDQGSTGAPNRPINEKLGETLSILDFAGIDPTGAVSSSAGIQTAIQYVIDNKLGSLYFPTGTYLFATPVIVNFDAQGSIRLVGTSMAGYVFGTEAGGTKFTGTTAIESMIIFTKSNLAIAGGYAFECSHINFISSTLGTLGPQSALKNKIAGAPARPFIVKNCTFIGFDKAILSDISGTGGLTTGICQVIIRENGFINNNHALYGMGGLGSIMDLVFCDNVSENGGKIYISGLGGTFNISDNLMEGQTDAIVLEAGLAQGIVARNYFEVNTGFLIAFAATNPTSSITLENLYILTSTTAVISISNCLLKSSIDVTDKCIMKVSGLVGKSSIQNSSMTYSGSEFPCTFDINSISYETNLVDPVITNGNWAAQAGALVTTPIGSKNIATSGVASSTTYASPVLTTNIGDAIVLQFLVRRRAGVGNFYALILDNAYTNGVTSNTSGLLYGTEIGEWVACVLVVNAIVASTPNIRVRFTTTGTLNIDVTDIYSFTIVGPTAASKIPLVLPN